MNIKEQKKQKENISLFDLPKIIIEIWTNRQSIFNFIKNNKTTYQKYQKFDLPFLIHAASSISALLFFRLPTQIFIINAVIGGVFLYISNPFIFFTFISYRVLGIVINLTKYAFIFCSQLGFDMGSIKFTAYYILKTLIQRIEVVDSNINYLTLITHTLANTLSIALDDAVFLRGLKYLSSLPEVNATKILEKNLSNEIIDAIYIFKLFLILTSIHKVFFELENSQKESFINYKKDLGLYAQETLNFNSSFIYPIILYLSINTYSASLYVGGTCALLTTITYKLAKDRLFFRLLWVIPLILLNLILQYLQFILYINTWDHLKNLQKKNLINIFKQLMDLFSVSFKLLVFLTCIVIGIIIPFFAMRHNNIFTKYSIMLARVFYSSFDQFSQKLLPTGLIYNLNTPRNLNIEDSRLTSIFGGFRHHLGLERFHREFLVALQKKRGFNSNVYYIKDDQHLRKLKLISIKNIFIVYRELFYSFYAPVNISSYNNAYTSILAMIEFRNGTITMRIPELSLGLIEKWIVILSYLSTNIEIIFILHLPFLIFLYFINYIVITFGILPVLLFIRYPHSIFIFCRLIINWCALAFFVLILPLIFQEYFEFLILFWNSLGAFSLFCGMISIIFQLIIINYYININTWLYKKYKQLLFFLGIEYIKKNLT